MNTSTTSGSHLSNTMDRTLEIWTPKLRWTPEHSKQIKIPKLIEAHSGSGVPQSAQTEFPSMSAKRGLTEDEVLKEIGREWIEFEIDSWIAFIQVSCSSSVEALKVRGLFFFSMVIISNLGPFEASSKTFLTVHFVKLRTVFGVLLWVFYNRLRISLTFLFFHCYKIPCFLYSKREIALLTQPNTLPMIPFLFSWPMPLLLKPWKETLGDKWKFLLLLEQDDLKVWKKF